MFNLYMQNEVESGRESGMRAFPRLFFFFFEILCVLFSVACMGLYRVVEGVLEENENKNERKSC